MMTMMVMMMMMMMKSEKKIQQIQLIFKLKAMILHMLVVLWDMAEEKFMVSGVIRHCFNVSFRVLSRG